MKARAGEACDVDQKGLEYHCSDMATDLDMNGACCRCFSGMRNMALMFLTLPGQPCRGYIIIPVLVAWTIFTLRGRVEVLNQPGHSQRTRLDSRDHIKIYMHRGILRLFPGGGTFRGQYSREEWLQDPGILKEPSQASKQFKPG